MATIRVTGITLQIDEAFFEEGTHPIDDALLPRLKDLAGVEVIEDTPQSIPKPPQPLVSDPEPDFPNHEGA